MCMDLNQSCLFPFFFWWSITRTYYAILTEKFWIFQFLTKGEYFDNRLLLLEDNTNVAQVKKSYELASLIVFSFVTGELINLL